MVPLNSIIVLFCPRLDFSHHHPGRSGTKVCDRSRSGTTRNRLDNYGVLELNLSAPTLTVAPRHVAIAVAGLDRWAAIRNLPLYHAWERGADALRMAAHTAFDRGVSYLTVALPSESGSSSLENGEGSLRLFTRFIRDDLSALQARNVRVKVVGTVADSAENTALLREAERMTAYSAGLTLTLAVGFRGRQQIAAAVRSLAERCGCWPPSVNRHRRGGDRGEPGHGRSA